MLDAACDISCVFQMCCELCPLEVKDAGMLCAPGPAPGCVLSWMICPPLWGYLHVSCLLPPWTPSGQSRPVICSSLFPFHDKGVSNLQSCSTSGPNAHSTVRFSSPAGPLPFPSPGNLILSSLPLSTAWVPLHPVVGLGKVMTPHGQERSPAPTVMAADMLKRFLGLPGV